MSFSPQVTSSQDDHLCLAAQQDAVPTSAADDRSASPHSDAARVVCSEKSKDYACGENNKISMATTGVKHKASPLKVERRGFQAMAKGQLLVAGCHEVNDRRCVSHRSSDNSPPDDHVLP